MPLTNSLTKWFTRGITSLTVRGFSLGELKLRPSYDIAFVKFHV